MESFSITKKSNFQDIEKAFELLEKNNSLRIRLPNHLQEKGVFGLEGLVCQFLATWLRNNQGGNILHSYTNEAINDSFEDLSSSLYGICALRLSDQVLTNRKDEISSDVALGSVFDRVRKIISGDFKNAYKGLYIAIPAIKATGKNREYNNPFYNQDKVIGREGFRKITEEALSVVVPQNQRTILIDDMKDNISEIIRELFENTHKHGRKDEAGNILPTNFRGVTFNSIDVTPERLMKLVQSGTEGMISFTAEWTQWMKTHNRNLPVLDITVVDSGPGYARRWTGKNKSNLSLIEEVTAVIECFKKNNSSGSNIADGSGLTHVLTDLKKVHGWFRLRTGSVAVSRSFFDGKGSVDIVEIDVKKVGVFVEGTSFNIVIPLVDITKEGIQSV